jgi:hypothetical protein
VNGFDTSIRYINIVSVVASVYTKDLNDEKDRNDNIYEYSEIIVNIPGPND